MGRGVNEPRGASSHSCGVTSTLDSRDPGVGDGAGVGVVDEMPLNGPQISGPKLVGWQSGTGSHKSCCRLYLHQERETGFEPATSSLGS